MSASNMTLPTAKWTSMKLAHPRSLSTRIHFFKPLNRSNTTPFTRHPPLTNVRPLAIAAPHNLQTPSSSSSSTSSKPSIRLPPNTYLPHTRATIIGAGMAGLLSAKVASKYFDEVVIIERDAATDKTIDNETLLETSKRRPGVPQMMQPHQLIVGGAQAIETIVPGFRSYIINKGGVDLDIGQDVYYSDWGAPFPRAPSELKGLGVSRRFIEQSLREMVVGNDNGNGGERGNGNVKVYDGLKVVDLLWEEEKKKKEEGDDVRRNDTTTNGGGGNASVRGVRVAASNSTTTTTTTAAAAEGNGNNKEEWCIYSDVVIDASGRTSPLPVWLEREGYGKVRKIKVDPKVVSASCFVDIPSDWYTENSNGGTTGTDTAENTDGTATTSTTTATNQQQSAWKLCVIKSQPFGTRGGSLLPTENNRWQVTLADMGSRGSSTAPRMGESWESMVAFAKTLPDQTLANALERCGGPCSPIVPYHAMINYVNCYNELASWPTGLIAVGDNVQALNAVYGQGMAVSAKSAVFLDQLFRTTLKAAVTRGEKRYLSRRVIGDVFRKSLVPSVTRQAWDLATGTDMRYPNTAYNQKEVPKLPAPMMAYVDAVAKVAQRDAEVYQQLLSVAHMVRDKSVLFSPRVVVLAVMEMMKGGKEGEEVKK